MTPSLQPPTNPATETVLREMRLCVRDMFDHALAECSIPRAFSRDVTCEGGCLRIGSSRYDLGAFSRVLAVSIGKAGHTMAEALASTVDKELTGVVACPNAPPAQLP